ncbi:thioesterase II family protein [Rhodococcus sp. ACPA1]|uniref:thioesterase II family protein n=1 Tax=Rhodococcus sp. ACPA1 TaxID=2028572 RepID=UPI0027BB1398|nr:alpha/beta fold hydrolase [Rhodococcus sp. ACPA1]
MKTIVRRTILLVPLSLFGVCMAVVVCVPPSGAGRSFFRRWPRTVDGARVVPLSRPGHEERMNEPLATSLTAAAADVAGRVLTLEQPQVVLFGHSIGATVAFEAARLLADDAADVELVVSARQAPQCAGIAGELAHQTDAELLATVQSWGAHALDQSVQDMLIPLLRADFELSASYSWDGVRVSVPVTALSYIDDVVVDAAEVRRWSAATSASHTHLMLPGGHFAASDPTDSLIAVLRDAVSRLRSGQPRV